MDATKGKTMKNFSRKTKNPNSGADCFWGVTIQLLGLDKQWGRPQLVTAVDIYKDFARIHTSVGSMSVNNDYWREAIAPELEPETYLCSHCGKPLSPGREVWLEMSTSLEWAEEGGIDDAESQGCFPFGPDCVPKVLKTQKCNWKANPSPRARPERALGVKEPKTERENMTYELRRDGKTVSKHGTENEAFAELHRQTAASIMHAIKYEGWSVAGHPGINAEYPPRYDARDNQGKWAIAIHPSHNSVAACKTDDLGLEGKASYCVTGYYAEVGWHFGHHSYFFNAQSGAPDKERTQRNKTQTGFDTFNQAMEAAQLWIDETTKWLRSF